MAGVGRKVDWLFETVVRFECLMKRRRVGKCSSQILGCFERGRLPNSGTGSGENQVGGPLGESWPNPLY